MEKIICPTDFTSYARNAVEYAQKLTQHLDARLLLFHSIMQPEQERHTPVGGVPFMEPIPDPDEKKAREIQVKLAKEKLFSVSNEFPGSESELRVGHITTSLPMAVKENDTDLIVIGHEGLEDVFPASNTSQIIKDVTCPVIIIPPHVEFKPIQKIVFATDLRGDAFTDIAFVFQLASVFNAEIQFLHILTDDAPGTRKNAEAELRLLSKRSFYDNVSYFMETDQKVEEGIRRFCFEQKADLLVMGSRNNNFWQYFLQSKIQEIAANTFLPLLVLPYRK